MIYIEKNTTNNIILELKGLYTTSTPYFLFEFIFESNLNQPYRYFTTDNISSFQNRYDEFVLEESDSGSDTNADDEPMNLNNGQYIYNIYISSSVIDVDDVVSIISNEPISTGRMVVSGTDLIVDPIYDSGVIDDTQDDTYL